MGECREYNIASGSEEHSVKPTESISKPVEDKTIESPPEIPVTASAPHETTTGKNIAPAEEHALGLEAALSSTVNQKAVNESLDKVVVLNPEQ